VSYCNHEIDGNWHIEWEDGICAYEDDNSNNLIVEKELHCHPFGTEYTEVIKFYVRRAARRHK